MKKFLLLFLISFISISNNFKEISRNLAYNMAIKNRTEVNNLYTQLKEIDKNKAVEFKEKLDYIESIFSRIYKTEKNLVPKMNKYIYFEALETEDKNILKEEYEKLMTGFNANPDSILYINNYNNASNIFIEKLKDKYGNRIKVYQNNDKYIFEYIYEDILKNYPNKNNFSLTEMRILIISPSSKIKEKIALAYSIFSKDIKGIEINDFAFLDTPRINLEKNSINTRINVYMKFINNIK